uniref:F-box domain-containing protein n=1 Tax=Plectus sambesii TaxID=2011161 RepID=A0A914UKH4_9BILA
MEEIGTLLLNGSHIIKPILRALSARELHCVSRVCQTWQKYVTVVLKERRRVLTMTATQLNQENALEAVVDNPETKRFLQDVDMDCGLTIMFLKIPRPWPRPHKAGDPPLSPQKDGIMDIESMRSCLTPSSALIGAVCTSGIIGTSVDGSCHEQKEHQEPDVDCLSAFLIPKSLPEGTQMSHFSLSLTQAKKLAKSEPNKATFVQAFQWPEDQAIKCIILMAGECVSTTVNRELASAIRTVYGGEVAFAGGITDQVLSYDCLIAEKDRRSDDENDEYDENEEYDDDDDVDYDIDLSLMELAFVGLVFGGENVRAASLVIGKDDRTKESIGERLMELKAKVEAWGECRQKFGFAFAHCLRDRALYDADEITLELFKELMPDIPLNGMFSFGEFGWDFPLPLAQPAKKYKPWIDDALSYTITFAIVGFV